ncbi:hypothetical protein C8A01DRAFT_38829 [Parachaetomium inaequale]|uniref:Uncharacterized protein n=1 Tax=Parachaetomium inaequale TaxID=2588326 RepID=A0AAN6SP06_9PEZI|nr:hypothetical protein C8A01DRAFT_38829 [Parachaetomium inaequale]
MAPELFSKIITNSWEARGYGLGRVGAIRQEIKEGVDELFAEMAKTMAQTPRLRRFTAVDVPRVLDLMILLQRHRPMIESINLAASANDNMGLIALPTFDEHHFLQEVQNNPNLIVPLANRINLCADLELEPVFSFPRLRSLSLTGLHNNGTYPGMYDPSLDPWTYDPYLAPLVSILMAAPNLTCLELSRRTCTGMLTSSGDFEPTEAGGKPLRLKALKLGHNCYLTMPAGPQHYLHNLTNLELLEDLRLEYDVTLHQRDWDLCYDTFVSFFTRGIHFPNFRHLTWPWMDGQLLIPLMVAARNDRLARVTLSCFDRRSPSSPSSSACRMPDTPEFWSAINSPSTRRSKKAKRRLQGLMLPCHTATAADTPRFLQRLRLLDPGETLKIRLPDLDLAANLTGGGGGKNKDKDKKARAAATDLWRCFAAMPDLRHLWLAAARVVWDGARGGWDELRLGEAEGEALAARFAGVCARLEYVRISDWAWRVVRGGAVEGGEVNLRALTEWEVRNELPEAFV